jgi:hypothetical protein
VTITGTRFNGVTGVAVNGKPALSVTVVSSTTIIAVVPLGASTGKISVTTSEGTGYSSSSFTVLLGL